MSVFSRDPQVEKISKKKFSDFFEVGPQPKIFMKEFQFADLKYLLKKNFKICVNNKTNHFFVKERKISKTYLVDT